jgi:hypothetical protein
MSILSTGQQQLRVYNSTEIKYGSRILSSAVSDLSKNTTYHFRAVADGGAAGIAKGAI